MRRGLALVDKYQGKGRPYAYFANGTEGRKQIENFISLCDKNLGICLEKVRKVERRFEEPGVALGMQAKPTLPYRCGRGYPYYTTIKQKRTRQKGLDRDPTVYVDTPNGLGSDSTIYVETNNPLRGLCKH